jgi:hypothetical protein
MDNVGNSVCQQIADKILIEGVLTLTPEEIEPFVRWVVEEFFNAACERGDWIKKLPAQDEIPY